MRPPAPEPRPFADIGFLALPVLCCLLGGLMAVLLLPGGAQAQAPGDAGLGDDAAEAAQEAGGNPLGGRHKGPYVLIECLEDAIVVHEAGQQPRRLELEKLEDEMESLVRRAQGAGFVALAVRAKAFGKPFARVFEPIRQKAKDGEGRRRFGYTYFPLQGQEPIAPYLPPRSRRARGEGGAR
ncbi:MAG: hypothetical protein ACLF0G_13690 [Candidatus Brocadiia bacterium]